MEASSRDRSSRMDASSDRRRTLKSSGSGRRRRRPPSVERMPDHSSGVDGSRMDASSAYMKGSSRSRTLDNSSAYSSSTGGGSHRRDSTSGGRSPSSNTPQVRDIGTGNGMESHSYAQKYKAAQALLEENHHKQKHRRPARRRSSQGGSSAGRDVSPGSKSPRTSTTRRPPTDKYKLIGRAGRRQSMDSAVATDNNSHGRSRGVPEKSLTATRLKKIFSPDAPSTTKPGNKSSPSRGVRRQSSMPSKRDNSTKGPPTRRIVERKTSGTGSMGGTGSRRSSMPSNGSGSEDSASGGLRKHRRSTRLPRDMASRTTTGARPKPKVAMMMDDQSISSMPSLAALDLSIHASGKRSNNNSAFTLGTSDGDVSPTVPRPFSLPKAPSISLLVDNAQSHAPTRATRDNEGELDEASTICNSVEDIYPVSVDSVDPGEDMSKSQSSRITDISRSDGSNSQPRVMESSSRIGGSRRRALSHDESGNGVPTRRKRSPRGPRSRSKGAIKSKRDSSRNLRVYSTSSERRPQRRASMAGRVSTEKELRDFGNTSNSSLQRANASCAIPKRQKSINALQRRHAAERSPRRQKSATSLKSANSSARRKSKKKKAKSVLSASLGDLNTMVWLRGSAKGKEDLQTAASEALAQIAGGGKGNEQISKRRNSVASVSSGSMESKSSRRSGSGRRRAPPRRSASGGSTSLASYDSAVGKRKERMRRSASLKNTPEQQRGSDATWSLADIDLGEKPPDQDASVLTPPTVSSSSAEDKHHPDTPRRKRGGLRRSQSSGSNYSGGGGKSHRQASQKSLPTNASKKEARNEPRDFPGVPAPNGKEAKDAFNPNADKLDLFKATNNQVALKKNGKQADVDNAFQTSKGRLDPFQLSVDPFQSHEEDKEEGLPDLFDSSLHDPFASSDPFGLAKPTQVKKGHVLGQPKPSDDMPSDSFHMTNDFGDFGHESFGSISFDNSQDFAVVPAKKGGAKSLLG